MIQIMDYLNTLTPLLMNNKLKVELRRRLYALRFGKEPVLISRHWCLCQNKLNALLGISKRYLISCPQDEEESEDALDKAVLVGLEVTEKVPDEISNQEE